MNSTAITTVLSVIEAAISLIPGAVNAVPIVDAIIKALETWLPIVTSEFTDLLPIFKNIIASLQGTGAVTDEQKATLTALDAQTDAAFEAAAKGIDPDAGDA